MVRTGAGPERRELEELAERLASVLESMSQSEARSLGVALRRLVDEKRRDIRTAAEAALSARRPVDPAGAGEWSPAAGRFSAFDPDPRPRVDG